MPAGIQAIGLFAPIVASNAVFSARRASKGVDSMSENPIYGAMNMNIAAAQVIKGFKAATEVAAVSNKDVHQVAIGASDAIKTLSKENKFVNGLSTVINTTANHINPIICATSAAKVLFGADDKLDAALRESIALGTMFGSEAIAKRVLGMPYTKKINGKPVTIPREALYKKNPFLEKQTTAIRDFCETKKLFNKISLKMVPGVTKGLAFVGASIAGYKLGNYTSDSILGEQNSQRA